jgi:hypothetical protein
MPSKSRKQQRFFGMVHAYQKGELKNPSPSIKKAAKSIDQEDVKHFAETKHKGLPDKVKKRKKNMKKYENVVLFTEYVVNEALLTLNKRHDVPEEDIQDVIDKVSSWFDENPNRTDCYVGIFGHNAWKIEKHRIEEDVRAASRLATPYKKANEKSNMIKENVGGKGKEDKRDKKYLGIMYKTDRKGPRAWTCDGYFEKYKSEEDVDEIIDKIKKDGNKYKGKEVSGTRKMTKKEYKEIMKIREQ